MTNIKIYITFASFLNLLYVDTEEIIGWSKSDALVQLQLIYFTVCFPKVYLESLPIWVRVDFYYISLIKEINSLSNFGLVCKNAKTEI